MEGPQNPAGDFVPTSDLDAVAHGRLIDELAQSPRQWHQVVEKLPPDALGVTYRNWTVRQIVHHVADSHLNSYIRFKWALTEDRPVIKAYDEAAWVGLADSAAGDVAIPLRLLAATHDRFCQLLRAMTELQFTKTFRHPETNSEMSLDDCLQYYPWHSRHHLGQIRWLAERHGWPT